jgi:hypothetical protein
MTFIIHKILGGGTLVEGTDITGKSGRTILRSERWDMYQLHLKHLEAEDVFDAGVKAAFAPLVEAAEAAKAILAKPASEFTRIQISEGTEFEPADFVDFEGDIDGVVLNMLDKGAHDQLLWVGEDLLVPIES